MRAGLAQRDRLGAGREARAGDDGDGGFVLVGFWFRDFPEFGAERVGRRQVLHVTSTAPYGVAIVRDSDAAASKRE